jgi:hypothetical protein
LFAVPSIPRRASPNVQVRWIRKLSPALAGGAFSVAKLCKDALGLLVTIAEWQPRDGTAPAGKPTLPYPGC